MELVDIGLNLTHESFRADREAVLARARAAGVVQMIVTGATVEASTEALELARERPAELRSTAGVHPHHASEVDDAAIEALRGLLTADEVVAVGECGLDYFRDLSPRALQRSAFERQLRLACDNGKPVFLHQRDAHADFHAIVRAHRPQLSGGVAHCFTAGEAELEAYLALDLAIGITGWICDERRGKHLVELVRRIPKDRLLLETDAPYLLPRDLRPAPASRRNEPAHLRHIAEVVAAARQESVEELAAHSTAAARALFRLPG